MGQVWAGEGSSADAPAVPHRTTVRELNSSDAKRILVTAALPYANGPIHFGHLAGAYLPADLYVRYQRLMGRDVLFICGSDEHGVPITISAEKEGVEPKVIVDRYHEMNREAFAAFGISFDNYSRTSLPLHHRTAQEFFLDFYEKGILKEKTEAQLYCERDRMFLADRYVEGTCPICGNPDARGDQCEQCGSMLSPRELVDPRCKICGTRPIVRETKHWYFPLGEYQKRLEEYVQSKTDWKDNVRKYCEGWFREGLEDRAVTRDLRWGVKVPLKGYEDKVLYVWFEAVLGYISSTKEWAERTGSPDRWKEYWQDSLTKYVAFIGKDNVVFHCIVFPAMIMAKGGYVLPDNVPANEFLNLEGGKLSKSRDYAIYLKDYLAEYPPDLLRYALAVNLPEYRDTEFTWKDFQARVNNELADTLGNLVNRTMTFAHKHFGGAVPPLGPLNERDKELLRRIAQAPQSAGALFEAYRFKDAVVEAMSLARYVNKYFNDSEPWKTLKSDRARCATTIHLSLQAVRSLAVLLGPAIPVTARAMQGMVGAPADEANKWEAAGRLTIQDGMALGEAKILFTKVDDERIDRELEKLGLGQRAAPDLPAEELVTIDDFNRIKLRTAKILAAERVPKSKKLVRLQIDLGTEKRQIVAGIAEKYVPEELVGRTIVVVANLQAARLMGLESRGMLLAANDGKGTLSLLSPGDDIPPGVPVK